MVLVLSMHNGESGANRRKAELCMQECQAC